MAAPGQHFGQQPPQVHLSQPLSAAYVTLSPKNFGKGPRLCPHCCVFATNALSPISLSNFQIPICRGYLQGLHAERSTWQFAVLQPSPRAPRFSMCTGQLEIFELVLSSVSHSFDGELRQYLKFSVLVEKICLAQCGCQRFVFLLSYITDAGT